MEDTLRTPGGVFCESCGTPLAGNGFGGWCPRCLLLGEENGGRADLSDPADLTDPADLSDRPDRLTAEVPAPPEVQAALEDYEVGEIIGRGGMGVVYRARQLSLDREVALKLLPGGGLDPEFAARFTREARITARLDHPSIVPVHEMDYDALGRGFYTMRLVSGRGLGEIFRLARRQEETWSLARAAGVMVKVCQAMAHAHGKGVAHRDLKPANIMVGALGEVYVMDWGLAADMRLEADGLMAEEMPVLEKPADFKPHLKPPVCGITAAAESLTLGKTGGIRKMAPQAARLEAGGMRDAVSGLTISGAVLGTPAYMAPEQALGRMEEVDALSDVYSLGAIIYEMLAGHPPYLPAGSVSTPREVLEAVADEPPPAVRELQPAVPAELAAICGKAMRRERSERYPSALELAEDLQAWLEGRVVRAHRTGLWPELRKWLRRNRALAASAAAAVLAVVAGLTATAVVQTRAAHRVRAALEDQRRATRQTQEALADARSEQGLRDGGEQLHARAALWFAAAAEAAPHDARRVLRNELRAALSDCGGPAVIRALGGPPGLLRRVDLHPSGRWMLGQLVQAGGAYLADLENETLPDLGAPGGLFSAAAWSPDGTRLAVSHAPGVVELREVPGFSVVARIDLPKSEAPASGLAWSADGRLLFLGGSPSAVWDAGAGRLLPGRLPQAEAPWAGVFSPDARHLLTITKSGAVRRWPLPPDGSEQPEAAHFEESFNALPAFTADGSRFRVMTGWTYLSTFDTASLARVDGRPMESGLCDTSADGSLLAGQSTVEKAADGQVIFRLAGMGRTRLAPDGSRIYHSMEGTLLDPQGQRAPLRLESQTGPTRAAFTPDGERLVTVQTDGIIRLWQLRRDHGRQFLPLPGSSRPVISADSRWLATAGEPSWGQSQPLRQVRFFSLPDGAPVPGTDGPPLGGLLINGAFSPDGARFAIAVSATPDRGVYGGPDIRQEGQVEIRDWRRGVQRPPVGPVAMPSEPRDLAWSADGAELAVVCSQGEVLRMDAATGAARELFRVTPDVPSANERRFENGSVAFTPDGRTLVVWGLNREIVLWDWAAGRMTAPPISVDWRPRAVLLHGDQLAAVLNERLHPRTAPWFWSSATGQALPSELRFEFPDYTDSGDLSEDGRLFLLGGLQQGLKLWDWRRGTVMGPDIPAPAHSSAAFVPGSPWILSVGSGAETPFSSARLWDRETGRALSPDWMLEGEDLRGLCLSPDGRVAVCGKYDYGTPGFHLLRLPGASVRDSALAPAAASALPPADLSLLRRLNAGGRIEAGGFVRQTSGEFLAQWREFRRRQPDYHRWPETRQEK